MRYRRENPPPPQVRPNVREEILTPEGGGGAKKVNVPETQMQKIVPKVNRKSELIGEYFNKTSTNQDFNSIVATVGSVTRALCRALKMLFLVR